MAKHITLNLQVLLVYGGNFHRRAKNLHIVVRVSKRTITTLRKEGELAGFYILKKS